MSTKQRTVLVALVLGVLALAVALEPTRVVVGKLAGDAFFEGRPTRYWAKQLRAGPADQAQAREALASGGAAAVPVLTALLERSSADDAELRWTAAELLAKLGPQAATAGPALLERLNDPDPHVQAVCAEALPKVEVPAQDAVSPLMGLLKTNHVVVAERALSQYRAAAAPAVPELISLLDDVGQPTDVRWNAARTLGKIGPDSIAALPALIAALADKEWPIREHCAEAIGELGSAAASEGVPALVPLFSDPVARVRRDAVRSLGHFGESARASAPEIEKLLDDPEEIVRDAAKKALNAVAAKQPIADEPADD